jgi:hypothetical protein
MNLAETAKNERAGNDCDIPVTVAVFAKISAWRALA